VSALLAAFGGGAPMGSAAEGPPIRTRTGGGVGVGTPPKSRRPAAPIRRRAGGRDWGGRRTRLRLEVIALPGAARSRECRRTARAPRSHKEPEADRLPTWSERSSRPFTRSPLELTKRCERDLPDTVVTPQRSEPPYGAQPSTP